MIMSLFVSLVAFVFIMVFVGWRVMLGVWGGLFLRVVALVNHLPPPSAVCWLEGAMNWVLFTFANVRTVRTYIILPTPIHHDHHD